MKQAQFEAIADQLAEVVHAVQRLGDNLGALIGERMTAENRPVTGPDFYQASVVGGAVPVGRGLDLNHIHVLYLDSLGAVRYCDVNEAAPENWTPLYRKAGK